MHPHHLKKCKAINSRRPNLNPYLSEATLQAIRTLVNFHTKTAGDNLFKISARENKSGNKQQQQQKQQKQAKGDKKKTSGGFPFKTLLFLTSLVLGGVIYSDVQTHGSWKDSNTALLLKRYKVCEYSHKVLNTTSDGVKWVNSKIEAQFPGYEKKLHETWQPYSEMLSDLGVISLNTANNAKDALVAGVVLIGDKIEEQAPGLLAKTGDGIKLALSTAFSYSKKSFVYLRDEFFVGSLSPENMGKTIVLALNTTQQKVNEYYVWAYEKVRTVIK